MRRPPKAPRSRPRCHFTGQVLGNAAEIKNNFTLNHQPVLVPGFDNLQGFNRNVAYVRELIS
jgi:hypothetical protein